MSSSADVPSLSSTDTSKNTIQRSAPEFKSVEVSGIFLFHYRKCCGGIQEGAGYKYLQLLPFVYGYSFIETAASALAAQW
jgi:hypothetical protein